MTSDTLAGLDIAIIIAYLVLAIGISLWLSKRGESSTDVPASEQYFVGRRKLAWWIAGTSMVATTFAADTPLAVVGLVAASGIAGNWIWWCWGVGHVIATFFFADLWRRSGVMTDAEIIELRYSGPAASWLRGFKAVYFGILYNCFVMAWVITAMVKLATVLFPIPAMWVVLGCIFISITYTTLGGFKAVVWTDLFQFGLGMFGAIALAGYVFSEPEILSYQGLLTQADALPSKQGSPIGAILPSGPDAWKTWIHLFALLLFGWWRIAEGNGYIVQRLAATKNEAHAKAASLWFAIVHNAIRPWPWIVVGLAAIVVFPLAPQTTSTDGLVIDPFRPQNYTIALPEQGSSHTQQSARLEFMSAQGEPLTSFLGTCENTQCHFQGSKAPELQHLTTVEARVLRDGHAAYSVHVPVALTDRELAYPLMMLRYLPTGLLGLVMASLLAAFMSTMDTHVNWGASYLTKDLYQRFVHPKASEKRLLMMSRLFSIALVLTAATLSTFVQSIAGAWQFIITLGAGLGSVTALRWYWHKVTAQAEIAALLITSVVAPLLQFGWLEQWTDISLFGEKWFAIIAVATTSLVTWLLVAYLGPQNDRATLRTFYQKVQPPSWGWKPALASEPFQVSASQRILPRLQAAALGIIALYASIFGLSSLVLAKFNQSWMLGIALIAFLLLWKRNATTHQHPAPPQENAKAQTSHAPLIQSDSKITST